MARVRVLPAVSAADPLFSQIPHRRSNKRPYDAARPVTTEQMAAIQRSIAGGASLRFVTSTAARQRLAAICTDGMAAEVRDRARNAETAKWFRFSNQELLEKRDGFNLEHNGRSPFVRWFAETFVLSRESSADPDGSFARGAIELTRDQTGSAAAFGVLTTAENSRTAQVMAGRAYARVALTVQGLGLAMHPLSQTLEEYGDMAAVKARMEREIALAPASTVQMLFRLGYADVTPHTPRRDVREMVRPA